MGLVEFFESNFNLSKIVPKFKNKRPYKIKNSLASKLTVKNPVLSNKCKVKKEKNNKSIKISMIATFL